MKLFVLKTYKNGFTVQRAHETVDARYLGTPRRWIRQLDRTSSKWMRMLYATGDVNLF